jgi:hypothetical protein
MTMGYNLYSNGKKQTPKTSRTHNAYTPQPADGRWKCVLCGKEPVPEEKRKSGEPRARWVSFGSKAQLTVHVKREHQPSEA